MPGLSSLERLRKVCAVRTPNLTVLMMTGGMGTGDELAACGVDIILKPILREPLRESVERALEQANERRHNMPLEPYTTTVAFARNAPPAPKPEPESGEEPSDQLPSVPPPTIDEAATLRVALAEFCSHAYKTGLPPSEPSPQASPKVSIPTPAPPVQPTVFDADHTAEMIEMPPLVIAGYTLGQPLAACEFAVVYQATREINGEVHKFGVEIIHLDPGAPRAARKLKNLSRAAKAATPKFGKLPLPVATTRPIKPPYVVHEVIRGRPLSEMIRSPEFSFFLRARVLSEIASALAVMHARNLCHRALKPANIIIDRKGHARIMDFGLASAPVSHIDCHGLAHRLSFHPPKCLQRGKVSEKSADVYAFGVLAYLLFAGHNPFHAATVKGVKLAMRNHQPPKLAVVVAGFPAELSEDLAGTLAKDAMLRPTSAELAMQLHSVLERTDPQKKITLPSFRMDTILE